MTTASRLAGPEVGLAMRPLRLAVIGCGAIAQSLHIPNIVASARLKLQNCCDVDAKVLEDCRRQFGVERVTSDFREAVADPLVDMICLAATERLRLPVIELAARLGKPIYVEKPLARTMEEVYQIQDVVRKSGIPFCVGHNRRCSPAMIDAHRIFRAHMTNPAPCPWRWDREGPDRAPQPGDGTAAISVRINDDWWSWKKWVFDKEQAPHGPMLFEMTHFIDMCNWFMAAEPRTVVAVESGMLNHAVIIQYATGELATITIMDNGTMGYPKELYEAAGNGGIVAVDHMLEVRTCGITGAPLRKCYPMLNDRHPGVGAEGGLSGWLAKKHAACEEAAASGQPIRQFTAEPDKGHARALERFAEQIAGGPTVCGVDDAVLATRVAFAAIASARGHRPVHLDEV